MPPGLHTQWWSRLKPATEASASAGQGSNSNRSPHEIDRYQRAGVPTLVACIHQFQQLIVQLVRFSIIRAASTASIVCPPQEFDELAGFLWEMLADGIAVPRLLLDGDHHGIA